MSLKDKIDLLKLPKHVAVIMDGNGRWAKKKGALRIFGHHNAIQSVRETAESAAELGIKHITLYAFSTENWSRPIEEVNGLMELLVKTISSEVKTLQKNSIKLNAIGNIASLPQNCQKELNDAILATAHNDRMTLNLALSYSGRWDIVEATKKIADDLAKGVLVKEEITESLFANYLATSNFPDPELMIRTSGEYRISNFMIWQLAYTELYITDVLWPDFRKEHFYEAIIDYQKRERRFGKTGEQIKTEADVSHN